MPPAVGVAQERISGRDSQGSHPILPPGPLLQNVTRMKVLAGIREPLGAVIPDTT